MEASFDLSSTKDVLEWEEIEICKFWNKISEENTKSQIIQKIKKVALSGKVLFKTISNSITWKMSLNCQVSLTL